MLISTSTSTIETYFLPWFGPAHAVDGDEDDDDNDEPTDGITRRERKYPNKGKRSGEETSSTVACTGPEIVK